MSNNIIDLSVTMRGDVTAVNLPDYVAAVKSENARATKTMYGATVVYMAARDLTDGFVAKDYAAEVGKSRAYVSTLAGLALAVDKGITPHGNKRDAERWSALTQRMTKAVRAVLKSDTFKRADLDAALWPTPNNDEDKGSEDKGSTDEGEDRTNRANEAKATPSEVQARALDALDGAIATLLHALETDKATPATRERFISLVAKANEGIAADDARNESPVPVKVVRRKSA